MTTLRFSRIVMISVLAAAGCASNGSGDGGTAGTTGAGTGGHAGGTSGTGNSAGSGNSTGGGGTTGGHAGTGVAGGSGQTAGTTGAGATTGTAGAGGQPGGNGGHAAGTSGQTAGAGGHAGGTTGQAGSGAGTSGQAGTTGAGGTSSASSCLDDMQNGAETGVDCGGSCGACPSYMINPPNLKNNVKSGCGNPASTSGFMCPRSMVFSPELKQAEADDFGSPTNPQFVYGTVGHDEDSGGLDKNNTCCECYQLVFVSSRDGVTGIPTPKPMIVQAFNTAAGGGKNFDIYMGAGGEGSNANGCPPSNNGANGLYTGYPSLGQPNSGGTRATNISSCAGSMNAYSETSIAATSCQTAIAAQCEMITSNSSSLQSTSQGSCEETSQPQSFYHMNWNVLAMRIECPTDLTRVTGCKLANQGLPTADPTAVDSNTATSAKGFLSGYTTTTMQDCCRPTCAYATNVTQSGAAVDPQYGAFYTCDVNGNPS